MKKVLFIASVTTHIKAFHLPYLELFKKQGYIVEVASNGDGEIPFCDKHHQGNFQRSPLKNDNINSYFELKRIIENGNYDIIHCHTPVAAMLTRLAARKVRKKGTRIIYTAHGFHFFKGAPLLNWLIYFPVEWICSFLTDTLITINTEDFEFAKKYLHAKKTEYVHGVGIDVEKFKNIEVDREKKREELGIPKDSIVLLSVGELSTRKNHRVILEAVSKIDNDKIYYLIAGRGEKKQELEELATELKVDDRFRILGFRSDIAELCKTADIFCFPSLQEGLPVALMEAMAVGVPCVASRIRGNTDLIKNGENGYLCDPQNGAEFAEKIQEFLNNYDLFEKYKNCNIRIIKDFRINNIIEEMKKIYG